MFSFDHFRCTYIFTVRFCLALLLCLGGAQAGDSLAISGRVIHKQTGRPFGAVNITIPEVNMGTASDKEGRFTLHPLLPGTYSLMAEHIGYNSFRQTIQITDQSVTDVVIALVDTTLQSDAIIVERDLMIGDPTRVRHIPGSAHFLDRNDLARFSYNDINRILREIPGINLQEEEGYGLRPNIGMRGTAVERSQKITLMEDGILIAPAPYSAPAAYYFPTVGRMQGVEVRKGSSQIKYGPYTTGGAMNLISTRIPEQFGGRMHLFVGKDNTRNFHVYAGDSYQYFGFLVETYQAVSDGFKRLDSGADTGFDKKDYLAKLRFNNSRSASVYHELTLKIGQNKELSNETYLGLTDTDFKLSPYRRYGASQMDQMDAKQNLFSARYFLRLSPAFDFTATAYRTNFKRNWYKLDALRSLEDGSKASINAILTNPDQYSEAYAAIKGELDNSHELDVKANNRSYVTRGLQAITGFRFKAMGMDQEMEVGLRYHFDQMDRFQWVDSYQMDSGAMKLANAGMPGTESNQLVESEALATFIQYSTQIGPMTIIPGLRHELIKQVNNNYGKVDPQRTGQDIKKTENETSVWIPGLGIDYALSPAFNLFAGIHKGFAPPGPKENTKPEESISYELGLRLQQPHLHTQAVIFVSDYENLLGSDLAAGGGQGTPNLFNGGAVLAGGLEWTAGYELNRLFSGTAFSLPLHLTYTYTRAEFQSSFKSDFGAWGEVQSGFQVPYIPEHQFYVRLALDRPDWRMDISGKYNSAMRTVAGKNKPLAGERTDSHFVIDYSAEYEIATGNRLFLSIRNVLDQTYIAARRPAGVRPGLPRTFLVGLKTEF